MFSGFRALRSEASARTLFNRREWRALQRDEGRPILDSRRAAFDGARAVDRDLLKEAHPSERLPELAQLVRALEEFDPGFAGSAL